MAIQSTINPISCPADEISAYIDGEIDLTRQLELDDHFAGCEVCSRELNQQKQFLRNLDVGLGREGEMELPANFTKLIVANAESTVCGLRRPRERYNALFICSGLLVFALFALGAEAGKLFQGLAAMLEQAAAVCTFFGHLIYSSFIGLGIILRSLFAQFQFDAAAALAMTMIVGVISLFISRQLLKTRRA